MKALLLLLSTTILLVGCVGTAVRLSCHLDAPAQEKPKERSAAFRFNIEYQYQGGTYFVEDVGRCTYEGRACDGRGLHNRWSFSLESGADNLRPTEIDTDLALYFPTGGCQALMSDDAVPPKMGVSVDPHRGPAAEWDPLGTQKAIDALAIDVVRFKIERLADDQQ